VVTDIAAEGEYQFERRRVLCTPDSLRELAEWLNAQQVEEGSDGIHSPILAAGVGMLEQRCSPCARNGREPADWPGVCTWRKPNPIGDREGARMISQTPSGWSNAWSHRN